MRGGRADHHCRGRQYPEGRHDHRRWRLRREAARRPGFGAGPGAEPARHVDVQTRGLRAGGGADRARRRRRHRHRAAHVQALRDGRLPGCLQVHRAARRQDHEGLHRHRVGQAAGAGLKHKYLIGVDLGTSATKAALYRPDGTLLADATVEVPLYYPKPGVVEQENDDFYRSAAQAVGRCVAASGIDARDVAALAFDSQMAGVGSIDEDFRPATRFDSWLDMRCRPYIEQLEREHGERITRLTGCPPTCDHGPKILWWREEAPQSYARIAKFLMPAGIVAGRMAGLPAEQAFIDYTFIHFSALSDARA